MEFLVGDYLEIEILEGFYRGEYSSRIVSSGDDTLVVTAPKMSGILVPLQNNQIIEVSFPRENARYDYDAKVVSLNSSLRGGNEYGLLTITVSEKPKRQQRRSDVRLVIKMPIELLYFYRQDVPVASFTVNSMDISAGGIRLEMPDNYPLHTKFKLAVHLPEDDVFVYAVIVRTGTIPKSESLSANPYWASMKFFNISENKQSKILKFIYRQQELRVKGLI
jgi:c-di-GMP-binding flagellar brake protein YcgR